MSCHNSLLKTWLHMPKSWLTTQLGMERRPLLLPVVSPLALVPSLPSSWPPRDMSGAGTIRTQGTTLTGISPHTMRRFRCCYLTDSWVSSWYQLKAPGITTSWVCDAPTWLCDCVIFPLLLGVRHSATMHYELQLAKPREFYHEIHRPAHFLNFTAIEEIEPAAADREDMWS